MSDVPMRGLRPSGIQTCTRALSDDEDCDAPATWHIWWRNGDDITSASCDQHYQEACVNDWEMRDAHLFGGVCLMPGTHWQFSAAGEEGFCFLPIDMDEVEVATAERPLVLATPSPTHADMTPAETQEEV